MSLEELWQLFPVVLREHDPRYRQWYEDEAHELRRLLGAGVGRLAHIGSTAVPGLLAKPTVDLLLETHTGLVETDPAVVETDALNGFAGLAGELREVGWTVMSSQQDPYPQVCLNKGYTPQGFAEKVYHLHVRRLGDWGEPYFRDYLVEHPDVAAEYASLKTCLAGRYTHDRDGYTAAKTGFVVRVTALARRAYPRRHAPPPTDVQRTAIRP